MTCWRCGLATPALLCGCCQAELQGLDLLLGPPELVGVFLRAVFTRRDGSWMLRRARLHGKP